MISCPAVPPHPCGRALPRNTIRIITHAASRALQAEQAGELEREQEVLKQRAAERREEALKRRWVVSAGAGEMWQRATAVGRFGQSGGVFVMGWLAQRNPCPVQHRKEREERNAAARAARAAGGDTAQGAGAVEEEEEDAEGGCQVLKLVS